MILKLKRTPGVYVVGFMASGKTTVGRMLAAHIGWPFADLDEDIEKHAHQSIPQIFETRGEAEFRRIESERIRSRVRGIECGRPLVLALGGGTYVQPEHAELLANNGVTVWLDCPLHMIEERVRGHEHRPLARDLDQMRFLYAERRELYARADFRIDACSDDPRENLDSVLALPIFH
jgi:shikimate kinase